jgi:hypothetical protein
MKTMNKQSIQALTIATEIVADIKERGEDAIGGTWDELRRELFTPDEIAASNLRVARMLEASPLGKSLAAVPSK